MPTRAAKAYSVTLVPCTLLRKDITITTSEYNAVCKNEQEERKLQETIVGINTLQKFKKKFMLRDIASMSHRMQTILNRASAKKSYSNFMLTPEEMKQLEADEDKLKQQRRRRARAKSAPETLNTKCTPSSRRGNIKNIDNSKNANTMKTQISISATASKLTTSKKEKRVSIASDLPHIYSNEEENNKENKKRALMNTENIFEHRVSQDKDFEKFNRVRINSWIESTTTEDCESLASFDGDDDSPDPDEGLDKTTGESDRDSKSDSKSDYKEQLSDTQSEKTDCSEADDDDDEAQKKIDIMHAQRYARLRRRSSLAENLKKIGKDFLKIIKEEDHSEIRPPFPPEKRYGRGVTRTQVTEFDERSETTTLVSSADDNSLSRPQAWEEAKSQVSKGDITKKSNTKTSKEKSSSGDVTDKKTIVSGDIDKCSEKSSYSSSKTRSSHSASTQTRSKRTGRRKSKSRISLTLPGSLKTLQTATHQDKISRRLMVGVPTNVSKATTNSRKKHEKPTTKSHEEDKVLLKRITIMRDLLNNKEGSVYDGCTTTTSKTESGFHGMRLQRRSSIKNDNDDSMPAMWELQRSLVTFEGNKDLDLLSMHSADSIRSATNEYEALMKCSYLRLPKYMMEGNEYL